jgi:hypothetical protein
MGVRMTELRKMARQFLSHNGMTPQEFAAEVATEVLLHKDDMRAMVAIAEAILNLAPASGDGW